MGIGGMERFPSRFRGISAGIRRKIACLCRDAAGGCVSWHVPDILDAIRLKGAAFCIEHEYFEFAEEMLSKFTCDCITAADSRYQNHVLDSTMRVCLGDEFTISRVSARLPLSGFLLSANPARPARAIAQQIERRFPKAKTAPLLESAELASNAQIPMFKPLKQLLHSSRVIRSLPIFPRRVTQRVTQKATRTERACHSARASHS